MIIACLIFLSGDAKQDYIGGPCFIKSRLRLFIKSAVDKDRDDTIGHVSGTSKYEDILLI